MKHSKAIIICSVLEILFGIASFLTIFFLMKQVGPETEATLGGFKNLFLAYIENGFAIFAGIVGIILAKKKSLFLIIVGVILVLLQAMSFFNSTATDTATIIANIVTTIVPLAYLDYAFMNYRSQA